MSFDFFCFYFFNIMLPVTAKCADIEQLPKIVMIDDLSTSDAVKQFIEIVSNCSVLAVDGEWDRHNCCFYQTNGIEHQFYPMSYCNYAYFGEPG